MDYGFAPGPEKDDQFTYAGRLRRFFQRRAQTRLVNRKGVGTVNEYVNFLKNDTSGCPANCFVVRPIGNVLLGAHANLNGGVRVQMFRGQAQVDNQAGLSDFETLEATLADPSNQGRSILLPDPLIGPDPTTHFFHFRGCNLGKATKFLTKWKQALGGKIQVTAPKHFHGVSELNKRLDDDRGTWEFMQYEFILRSPTRLASTDALAAALAALQPKLTFADGTAVDDGNWGPWLKGLNIKNGSTIPLFWPLTVGVTNKTKLRLGRVLTVANPGFKIRFDFPSEAQVPLDEPTQRQTMRQFLLNDAGHPPPSRYTPAHPFPIYERRGFADFDAFFNAHTWSFKKVSRIEKVQGVKTRIWSLQVIGDRFVYTVMIPITSPNPGPDPVLNTTVLVNFIPNSGTAPPGELLESDEKYFATV
jgi:hypothetical protein